MIYNHIVTVFSSYLHRIWTVKDRISNEIRLYIMNLDYDEIRSVYVPYVSVNGSLHIVFFHRGRLGVVFTDT